MSSEKRMTRRLLLRKVATLGAGLALAGPILAACGPTAPPTAAPKKEVATPAVKAPAAKEVVKLRFHAFTGRYATWAERRANKFNGENPSIQVTVEPIAGAEYATKLRSMYATKTIGDSFWYWNVSGGWHYEWQHLGITRDCEEFIKAEGIDLKQWFPAAIEGLKVKGKIMGLPIHGGPGFVTFAYNKKLLDAAGIKYPPEKPEDWKLDTIIETGKKLTIVEGDKIKQFGWGSMTGYHPLMTWARKFGTDIIDKEGKKSLINTDRFKQMLQWIVDAKWKYNIEPQPEQVEKGLSQMFVAGRCAMQQVDYTIGSVWHVEIKDFDWHMSLIPKGPYGDWGGQMEAHLSSIVTASKYPAETFQFVKYMSSHEAGVDKLLQGAGAPGLRPDVYNDPQVIKQAPEYKVIELAYAWAPPEHVPGNYRGQEYITEVNNSLQDIWLKKVDVAKGAEIAHKAVQDVLDKQAE